MARAATTSDVFNAVAEPARRTVLEALRNGEASVNAIVETVGLTQPQVSKHLRVLREVDLVASRSVGKERRYRIHGAGLQVIHEWTGLFAQLWNDRLDRLDDLLDGLGSAPPSTPHTSTPHTSTPHALASTNTSASINAPATTSSTKEIQP